MSTTTEPAVPTGILLELGRIPRDSGPDEPFALLIGFESAEDLRAAVIQLKCNLKFEE